MAFKATNYKAQLEEEIKSMQEQLEQLKSTKEDLYKAYKKFPNEKSYERDKAWDECYFTGHRIERLEYDIFAKQLLTKVGTSTPVYCNEIMYSDRHAYEVLDIISTTGLLIRRLKATRTDNNGISECQSYSFEPSDFTPIIVRRHKGGLYYQAGCKGCFYKLMPEPYEYFDFSF